MTSVFSVVIQYDARLREGGAALFNFQESKPAIAALHAELRGLD